MFQTIKYWPLSIHSCLCPNVVCKNTREMDISWQFLKSTHTEQYFTSEQDPRSLFVTNSYQKSLKFQFSARRFNKKKWLSCVQSLFSYIPLYKKNNIKKTKINVTKIYTEKLKQDTKSIQDKNSVKIKSKLNGWSFFAPTGQRTD